MYCATKLLNNHQLAIIFGHNRQKTTFAAKYNPLYLATSDSKCTFTAKYNTILRLEDIKTGWLDIRTKEHKRLQITSISVNIGVNLWSKLCVICAICMRCFAVKRCSCCLTVLMSRVADHWAKIQKSHNFFGIKSWKVMTFLDLILSAELVL